MTRGSRLGSAVVAFSLGAAFLIAGLVAAFFIARGWWAEAEVHRWSERTATIVEARAFPAPRGDQDPVLTARFQYDYDGRTYESDRVDARSPTHDADAYRLATLWQPGSTWPCYVDPRNPQVAVLRRNSLWWGFAGLFPLIFGVCLGGLFIYGAWASLHPERDPAPARRNATRIATGLLVVVLVVTSYVAGVRPLILFADAAHWRESSCTIAANRVRAYRARQNRTEYRPDVIFRYQHEGREYVSSDYALDKSFTSSYRDAEAVVQRYPPGVSAGCYVNPRAPAQAVLDRSFPKVILLGLLPFGFLLLLIWGLVRSGTRAAGPGRSAPSSDRSGRPNRG
jgi:Protein of unknown function (DUF3592)